MQVFFPSLLNLRVILALVGNVVLLVATGGNRERGKYYQKSPALHHFPSLVICSTVFPTVMKEVHYILTCQILVLINSFRTHHHSLYDQICSDLHSLVLKLQTQEN